MGSLIDGDSENKTWASSWNSYSRKITDLQSANWGRDSETMSGLLDNSKPITWWAKLNAHTDASLSRNLCAGSWNGACRCWSCWTRPMYWTWIGRWFLGFESFPKNALHIVERSKRKVSRLCKWTCVELGIELFGPWWVTYVVLFFFWAASMNTCSSTCSSSRMLQPLDDHSYIPISSFYTTCPSVSTGTPTITRRRTAYLPSPPFTPSYIPALSYVAILRATPFTSKSKPGW